MAQSGLLPGERAIEPLIEAASDDLETEMTSKNDVALWNFSGGTTGKPKGVPTCITILSMGSVVQPGMPTIGRRHRSQGAQAFFSLRRDWARTAAEGRRAVALFSEQSSARIIFEMIGRYRPTSC
jgi:acyl-CoA synthetase (AMP-forming)/AMP-acid ligase II